MYKRLKCVLAIVSLGIILVGRQMNNEEKSPKNETKTSKHVSHQKMTKKQQLAYLKEHEQEIIDYVKSQNNKIESVQIDWSDIRWSKGGNGTPQGGGEGILLLGRLIIILNQVGELILIQKKDG
ncbi:lipoprotein BUG3 [Streptococcus iniae]|nr:lipoprotein BUG3 [Streptococcus iniae]